MTTKVAVAAAAATTRIAIVKSRFALCQRVLLQYGHFPTVTVRVVTVHSL
jgi:hypothetical protein